MNGKHSGAGKTVGVTQICKLEREVIALAQADEKTSTVQGNTAKVEAGRGAVKAGCGAGPCVGFPSPPGWRPGRGRRLGGEPRPMPSPLWFSKAAPAGTLLPAAAARCCVRDRPQGGNQATRLPTYYLFIYF